MNKITILSILLIISTSISFSMQQTMSSSEESPLWRETWDKIHKLEKLSESSLCPQFYEIILKEFWRGVYDDKYIIMNNRIVRRILIYLNFMGTDLKVHADLRKMFQDDLRKTTEKIEKLDMEYCDFLHFLLN